MIKHLTRVILICLISFGFSPDNKLRQNFVNPPLSLKSRPLWFWNAPLSREQTRRVMTASRDAGYYGLGILPSYGMTPEYMTPEFMAQYKFAVELADSLGMKLYLYDEFYFPSGMAGGKLSQQYPEAVSKRLDMNLFEVKGGSTFTQPMPGGTCMGAVAMESGSKERIDLSSLAVGDRLTAKLPAGDWKVMVFTLQPDSSSGRNHCDYLSPEAVGRFIGLTYEKFYQAFPEHFGTTIDYAFYDEPCLRWVDGARTWTGDFNKKFQDRYGFSPVLFYPSLWFDIGTETEAARNALLGFRADLYSAGFPKTINDWCRAHHIQLTGHVDQEEILNPVATCGDLMKAFKYQDIPAVDEIFFYGRSSFIYKVISSSAYNYDRPVVATECYGATGRFTVDHLYKEAMDQFAKGINLMEPHAVWYTDAVDIQPDLSPASKKFGAALPAFNEYTGRLQAMLQGGRHIADIAVLYPIASLQGSYHFGPGDPGMGGIIPGEADYLDIGEMLSLKIRRDFTFIHPEILDEKCIIKGDRIRLNNKVNEEEFKVFILPGSRTIQLDNILKIKDFYDRGGKVIATSLLPDHSAEPGRDREVQEMVKAMFGADAYDTHGLMGIFASSTWNTGGFIPSYAVDGKAETSWRPSQDNRSVAELEIGLGGTFPVRRVKISATGDAAVSCQVCWMDSGKVKRVKNVKIDKIGFVEGEGDLEATAIRIELDSTATEKTAIAEVEILDPQDRNILSGLKKYTLHTNTRGGRAYFIPAPDSGILKTVLDDTGINWDTRFENEVQVTSGNLTYIHKYLNGMNIWFFANSSAQEIDVPVILKGNFQLQVWDPYDGRISGCDAATENRSGEKFTRASLKLGPLKSVFWVDGPNGN